MESQPEKQPEEEVEETTEEEAVPASQTPSAEETVEEEPVTEEEVEVVEEEEEPEPYTLSEAWGAIKERGRRFRKAVLYPATKAASTYVQKSLDAADELADGFEGKKRKK